MASRPSPSGRRVRPSDSIELGIPARRIGDGCQARVPFESWIYCAADSRAICRSRQAPLRSCAYVEECSYNRKTHLNFRSVLTRAVESCRQSGVFNSRFHDVDARDDRFVHPLPFGIGTARCCANDRYLLAILVAHAPDASIGINPVAPWVDVGILLGIHVAPRIL